MTPKIAFLFPLRWLTDKNDRKYFKENIIRSITHRVGKDNIELLQNVIAYKVVINLFYHKPLRIPLTKLQIQTLLEGLMPASKCISLENEFTQTKSKTMSPSCEIRFFF